MKIIFNLTSLFASVLIVGCSNSGGGGPSPALRGGQDTSNTSYSRSFDTTQPPMIACAGETLDQQPIKMNIWYFNKPCPLSKDNSYCSVRLSGYSMIEMKVNNTVIDSRSNFTADFFFYSYGYPPHSVSYLLEANFRDQDQLFNNGKFDGWKLSGYPLEYEHVTYNLRKAASDEKFGIVKCHHQLLDLLPADTIN